jgi:hypothetical protein
MRLTRALSAGILLALLVPLPVRAQQRGAGQPEVTLQLPVKPMVPLKVQVVVSRYQGQKQTGRVPFTLSVNANDRKAAEVTSATQVLIPMVTVGEKTTGPVFKDVGISIRCLAASVDGNRFALDLNVESASIDDDQPKKDPPYRIRAFRSSQQVLLRDGQTMEYTTATDPVNGEEVKVAVTMTVVK